jgi:electron transport complex protein RnfC
MKQHPGMPADVVVSKGDFVDEGQLIGLAKDRLGANVHATVPGRIIDVGGYPTVNGTQPVVVVEAEGAFTTTGSLAMVNAWEKLEGTALLKMISDAGIVGLGGFTLPAFEKITNASEKKAHTLIINAVESEPYLTADDILMKTYPSEILEGIYILLKITGLKKAFIGIEYNKDQSIKALNAELTKNSSDRIVTIKRLKTKYPQCAEKLLVYSILGETIPLNAYPSDVGVLILNVATVYAIREAVIYNKPLIDRYITVSGSMINRPGNYKVRIGTRISDIIEECGGLKDEPFATVMGGPMRGCFIKSFDIPVEKGTTGVLFLSGEEVKSVNDDSCIRCGRCISVCPAGLVPRDIAGAAEIKRFDLINSMHLNSCIMCNCCSYICPSKRPLSFLIEMAKENIR